MKRIGWLRVKGNFFHKSGKFWTLRTANPTSNEREGGWKAKEGDLVYLMSLKNRRFIWEEDRWYWNWNKGRVLVGHADNTGAKSINKGQKNFEPIFEHGEPQFCALINSAVLGQSVLRVSQIKLQKPSTRPFQD